MSGRCDVIVIGGGHNGLTTATLLAKKGKKVIVVERRDVLGGLAAGEEFHPGYRTAGVLHDTSGVRPWVVKELGLEGHGLKLHVEAPPVFIPERDSGQGLLLWRSPEQSAEELARLDSGDAESYAAYRTFMNRVAPVIGRLLDRPPADLFAPKIGDFLALGRAGLSVRLLGEKDMMELLRIGPMCVADWLGEWFESELLKAALAGPAVHRTYAAPWSPGTNTNLLWGEGSAGLPVKGGPRALVAALTRAAEAAGVTLRTGAQVDSLVLENSAVRGVSLDGGEVIEAGAVAASCDPRHLILDLVPGGSLPRAVEDNMLHYHSRGTTAKVHLALDRYPEFACRPTATAAYIRTGETLDEIERAFDPVKYRDFSRRPVLDIYIPTAEASGLAPAGHHVVSIEAHYAPFELEDGWGDHAREVLGDAVVATLGEYVPGLEESIVAREVLTPADLAERHGVTGGSLHHGEHAIDQLLVRPTPECAGYKAPFEGLFLCGSGSHPGGGITCAPGALAARTILRA